MSPRGENVLFGLGLVALTVLGALFVRLEQTLGDDQTDVQAVSAGSGANRSTTTTLQVTTTTTAPTTTSAATVPARPPADTTVLALNATPVIGLGGRISDRLATDGYDVLPPGPSPPSTEASVVHFVGDFEPEARAVAETLGLAPTTVSPMPDPPPVANVDGAQVVVVIGADLA